MSTVAGGPRAGLFVTCLVDATRPRQRHNGDQSHLVRGAHGPAWLHVVLVGEETAQRAGDPLIQSDRFKPCTPLVRNDSKAYAIAS
jgi:hypothetical protein